VDFEGDIWVRRDSGGHIAGVLRLISSMLRRCYVSCFAGI